MAGGQYCHLPPLGLRVNWRNVSLSRFVPFSPTVIMQHVSILILFLYFVNNRKSACKDIFSEILTHSYVKYVVLDLCKIIKAPN